MSVSCGQGNKGRSTAGKAAILDCITAGGAVGVNCSTVGRSSRSQLAAGRSSRSRLTAGRAIEVSWLQAEQ